MTKYEKTIVKRFEQMIQSANSVDDLIEIENFINDNKNKVSLKGLAYNYLLCLLGSEESTQSQIAFAYFIVGQTYDDPNFRYLYFTTAADYFNDIGSDLYVLSLRKKEYALFQIDIADAFRESKEDEWDIRLLFYFNNRIKYIKHID